MKRRILLVCLVFLGGGALLLASLLYQPGGPLPGAAVAPRALEHAGLQRTYILQSSLDRAPGGILFALHPSRSSGAQMRRMVGHVLEPLAAQAGLLVVYPDGFEGHFNDCRKAASYSARKRRIDDVGFLQAIARDLGQAFSFEPERNYLIGYSNGAHMGFRLALEAPAFLHGLIAVSANLPTDDNLDCRVHELALGAAVLMAGTADPINPYPGGRVTLFGFGNRGSVHSAADSAAWLAGAASGAGKTTQLGERNGLRADARDWLGARPVRLISIRGGGHLVPQSQYRFMRLLGPRYAGDELLHNAWQFVLSPAQDLRRKDPG